MSEIKRRHDFRLSHGDGRYAKVAICSYCGKRAYDANYSHVHENHDPEESCPLGIEVLPVKKEINK